MVPLQLIIPLAVVEVSVLRAPMLHAAAAAEAPDHPGSEGNCERLQPSGVRKKIAMPKASRGRHAMEDSRESSGRFSCAKDIAARRVTRGRHATEDSRESSGVLSGAKNTSTRGASSGLHATEDSRESSGGSKFTCAARRKLWTFVITNSTTCKSGEEILAAPEVSSADIVAWQEHHIADPVECNALRAKLQRGKWNCFLEASLPTDGGTSAGVALLTRKHIGQRPPSFAPTSVCTRGRVIYRHVDGVIPGGLIVACVYLPLRQLAEDRRHSDEILFKLGRALASHGRPFVVLGDWNMVPDDVSALGLPERMCATLVRSKHYTCFSGTCVGTVARHLDFFLVSDSLVGLIHDV